MWTKQSQQPPTETGTQHSHPKDWLSMFWEPHWWDLQFLCRCWCLFGANIVGRRPSHLIPAAITTRNLRDSNYYFGSLFCPTHTQQIACLISPLLLSLLYRITVGVKNYATTNFSIQTAIFDFLSNSFPVWGACMFGCITTFTIKKPTIML